MILPAIGLPSMAFLPLRDHNNAMRKRRGKLARKSSDRGQPAPLPVRHILVALWWWDQRLLEGIARFAAGRGWILDMRVRFANRIPIRRSYDGALVFSGRGRSILRAARAIHGPVVNLDQHRPIPGSHGVYCDDGEVGRAAAEHLLACGVQTALFLQVRARRSRSEMARFQGFRRRLREADISVTPTSIKNLPLTLRQASRPLGLMAGNDEAAVEAIGVCRELGIAVPDDAAIVGVDNFLTTCLYAPVQLSSVDLNLEVWGLRAAAALEARMEGKIKPHAEIIPSNGVVMRASSDVAHRLNPGVSKALRYMRNNYQRHLRISEIVRHVGLSRQTLQNYFQSQLRRSMLEHLTIMRLQHAMELMRREGVALSHVAVASGFRDYQHFHRSFGAHMNTLPSKWRKAHATPIGRI